MVEDLILEAQLDAERNDRIFSQLEEAVTVSLEPLDKMFRKVGLDPDNLIEQVRRGYGTSRGPRTPLALDQGQRRVRRQPAANAILERSSTR